MILFYYYHFEFKNNNCYSYAFNRMSNYSDKPQPGKFSNIPPVIDKKNYTCKNFINRVLSDNKNARFVSVNDYKNGGKCKDNETSVFLAIDNKGNSFDYHFYKKEFNDKYWSHKPGTTYIRNYDSNKIPITDPITADRNYEKNDTGNKYKWDYSLPCGFFCNKK